MGTIWIFSINPNYYLTLLKIKVIFPRLDQVLFLFLKLSLPLFLLLPLKTKRLHRPVCSLGVSAQLIVSKKKILQEHSSTAFW